MLILIKTLRDNLILVKFYLGVSCLEIFFVLRNLLVNGGVRLMPFSEKNMSYWAEKCVDGRCRHELAI